MKADTNVRSVMLQQQDKAQAPQATGAASGQPPAKTNDVKVPSMLEQDEPVYVKSNRLDYDSGASLATYDRQLAALAGGDTAR